MITLLSPSKSMDMQCRSSDQCTQALYLDQAEDLVTSLRQYSPEQLGDFMEVSPKLAQLNHERFLSWSRPFTPDNAKPALWAFTGDVYDGLEADSLTEEDQSYAQSHLRILSGLYGILRPLDLIQPYRLEMGRALKTATTSNLYTFWQEQIKDHLISMGNSPIINLASQEYFRAVPHKEINHRIISPVFKDEKNGTFKIISFYAKKARGLMARFIINERIERVEDLQAFAIAGYAYNAALSTEDEPVFTRSAA